MSARYAIDEATLDVWYSSVVGTGRIEVVLATPPKNGRISIELTDEERILFRAGVLDWGGPANCTDELAREMGFTTVADLLMEGHRQSEVLKFNGPLSLIDWRRYVVAAETCFTLRHLLARPAVDRCSRMWRPLDDRRADTRFDSFRRNDILSYRLGVQKF